MGNLIAGFKKIIVNKNTVTILGVILSLGILLFCYRMRINASIKPIKVPYAKTQIVSGIQITEDMVGITEVPPSMLEGDVLYDRASVIDKYSNADTTIPEGSLFYKRTVVEKDDLPANVILDYPSGYVLYNLPVTTESSYGNSIYPGNYIDIYLKVETLLEGDQAPSRDDKVMLGKLLSNVKIIAVRDQDGLPVFENPDETRTPAMVIFALPEEYYILLKKAEYLRTYDSKLLPVPTNESMKAEPGELEATSEALKEWINRVTIWTEN